MISKKLISQIDMNVFPRVVWMFSQLKALVLKFPQENLDGQKSTVWKAVTISQYLLTRMLYIIFICGFFRNF